MHLTLATTSAHKKREWEKLLEGSSVTLSLAPLAYSAPEPYLSFAANARAKVLFYQEKVGGGVLAEDAGFLIEGLGNFPGVFSARLLPEESYAVKNQKITAFFAHHEKLSRRCVYRSDLSIFLLAQQAEAFQVDVGERVNGGVIFHFKGEVEGIIATTPRGENGFGYDPIFYLPEQGKTMAELSLSEKNRLSHRARAAENLLEFFSYAHA